MNRKSQCQVVLSHMRHIGPITQWGAIRHYRITRLGARIWDLKHDGHEISPRWIERKGKRFKEYALA